MSANKLVAAADRESTENTDKRAIHGLRSQLLTCEAVESAEIRVEGQVGVFRESGERELRPYGSSTRFTFTRTSLDLSGFAADETVTVYARDGAILLVADDAADVAFRERIDVIVDATRIPDDVTDVVENFGAALVPECVRATANGKLSFALTLPSSFERVTVRDVRPFGDSTAFTIPPEALAIAGLDDGDRVAIRAADGAVLMSRA